VYSLTTLYDYIIDFEDIDELVLLRLASEEVQEDQYIRTGLLSREYIKELLGSNHPERVFQVLRIQLATFYSLRDWLLNNTSLEGDNIINDRIKGHGKRVSIEEKIIIFLYIITRAASNHDTSEKLSRSGNTISRYIF